MAALTVAPSEFGALLDAISGVGDRVDALRADTFATVNSIREDHDSRIASLEMTRERGRAVSEALGERRKALTIGRRWIIGIVVMGGLTAIGATVDLIRLLTGAH